MSEYPIDHLAQNVRIGQNYEPWWGHSADRAGIDRAVWQRPGFITMEEVYDLLGTPLELRPMYNDDLTVSEYQRVVNPNTGTRIGPPVGQGYVIHQPAAWLAKAAEPLVKAFEAEGFGVVTVLQLGDGAKSALTLGTPDALQTKAGMEVRPYTALKTSHDQSLATATHNGHTVVVCDNTARSSENGTLVGFKVKHTSKSGERHGSYVDAVARFHGYGAAVIAEIDRLAAIDVTEQQFETIVKRWLPEVKADSKASQTKFDNAQDRIVSLWRHDLRCAPWKNTGLGVVQTLNTFQTHYATVRGMHRAERQMENMLTGADIDAKARTLLAEVTGKTLVAV